MLFDSGEQATHNSHDHHHKHFDRCQELVFDAAIEDEKGVHYFFKGE